MTVPVSTLREDLVRARRLVARAEGELAAIEARKGVLDAQVGAAKGRLALKPKVDAFLEELQAEAHQKRVGDFERLLTAVVQEVLPGEFPIGLDLQIERGQPSLDIVSRRRLDQPEDIYDDQGGALTNVVSMGLRVIAAVRSNTRRFLVLDEGDCWIAVDRVPSFYKVLTDAAGKLGVQCFVISHHDIASFGGAISVAKLSGDKDMGVRVENSPRRHRWQPGEEGIASVRLRNFQSFVDETVHLAPGVNALIGPNNLGKSALVRALRAVFQGECRDSLIRHGERGCAVEVAFANGRTLRWDRQLRRNPINVWKLLGPDGAVVTENGMTYETGGRTAPEWVGELFGIGPVEGLDVHIVKQKTPTFLLDKPGSTRAAVLSIGQESSHIRTMIQTWKDDCAADATKVRDGEREMSGLRDRLERFATLPQLRERLEAADGLVAAIEARREEIARLEAAAALLERSRSALALASVREAMLGALPAPEALRAADAEAAAVLALEASAEQVASAKAQLARDCAVSAALSALPAAMPELVSADSLEGVARKIEVVATRIDQVNAVRAVLMHLPGAVPKLEDGASLVRAEEAVASGAIRLSFLYSCAAAMSGLPAATPELTPADRLVPVAERSEAAMARIDQANAVRVALSNLPIAAPKLVDGASLARAETAMVSGAAQLSVLHERQTALSGLPGAKPELAPADPLASAAEQAEAAKARIERATAVRDIFTDLPTLPVVDAAASAALDASLARIERVRAEVGRLVVTGTALAALPDAAPALVVSEPIIQAGFAIREGHRTLAALQVAGQALAALPDRLPEIATVDPLVQAASKVEAARHGLAESEASARRIAADLETDERDLKEALAEMGNACPVCGCSINDPSKLLHAHATHARGVADAA